MPDRLRTEEFHPSSESGDIVPIVLDWCQIDAPAFRHSNPTSIRSRNKPCQTNTQEGTRWSRLAGVSQNI
ncbi:hypothetical protein TNCV_2783221 [Trichonephila clavipes]|nr:hypothetical protein TNCV_2783221 [Trichonephila clavipes]